MFEASIKEIEAGIASGLHPGAQAYVSLKGEVLLDGAWGTAHPGVPLSPSHLTLWLSSCKPITAIAIGQQMERRGLDIDRPVAEFIPAFAQHNKGEITVRHVLTHQGGFRSADVGWKPRPWNTAIEMICTSRPEPQWVPGEKAGYHVDSGWYVLGEIVRLLDGRDFGTYLRDEIFLPLGMSNSYVGVPNIEYDFYGDRISSVYDCSVSPMREEKLFSRKEVVGYCRPGGNGRGPARELGRFYEAMLGGGALNGRRIIKAETLAEFTRVQRADKMDHSFQHVMDWGLGFMCNSNRHGPETVPYGFGSRSSDCAFGHGGNRSSVAFADPAHGLAVVVVFNGMALETEHQLRMRRLLPLIYSDAGL